MSEMRSETPLSPACAGCRAKGGSCFPEPCGRYHKNRADELEHRITAAHQERDTLAARVAMLEEALRKADKLADLAVTLTGCPADDEHVASVKAAITVALSTPAPASLAALEKRIREDEARVCAGIAAGCKTGWEAWFKLRQRTGVEG